MDKKWIIIAIITVAIIFLTEVLRRVLTNYYSKQLMNQLLSSDFNGFFDTLNKKIVQYLLPPFNRDYLKLNAYIAQSDKKKTDELFKSFETKYLNAAQKEAVNTKGFFYYLSLEEKGNTRKYYDRLMETLTDEVQKRDIDRLFNTYIIKGKKYLKETLEEIEDAPIEAKGQLEALVAKMYENDGNEEESDKHLDLAMMYQQQLIQKTEKEKEE